MLLTEYILNLLYESNYFNVMDHKNNFKKLSGLFYFVTYKYAKQYTMTYYLYLVKTMHREYSKKYLNRFNDLLLKMLNDILPINYKESEKINKHNKHNKITGLVLKAIYDELIEKDSYLIREWIQIVEKRMDNFISNRLISKVDFSDKINLIRKLIDDASIRYKAKYGSNTLYYVLAKTIMLVFIGMVIDFILRTQSSVPMDLIKKVIEKAIVYGNKAVDKEKLIHKLKYKKAA